MKHLTGTRKTHTGPNRHHLPDTRERIALDISLLKKQYSKLRERQRHTTLTDPAKQTSAMSGGDGSTSMGSNNTTKPSNINQYLIGRNAIVSNKKRQGPPSGAIPPMRTALPMSVANKYHQKRLRNATIDNASTSTMFKMRSADDNSNVQKKKAFARGRSESSSYSEDSDDDELDNHPPIDSSSSSTSLCDDDFGSVGNASSMDASPMKSRLHSSASDDSKCSLPKDESVEYTRFQSDDANECHGNDGDGDVVDGKSKTSYLDLENNDIHYQITGNIARPEKDKSCLHLLSLPQRDAITSTSQLSPIENISNILSTSTISPLKTPTSYLLHTYPLCDIASNEGANSNKSLDIDFSLNTGKSDKDFFKVSDEGVTNAYFERINHVATINRDSKFPFSFIEDTPDDSNLGSRLSQSSQEGDDDDDDAGSFKSEVRRLSGDFESAIILIDQADKNLNKTSPISSNSNANSDAILKMIQENSKILDRIMCKNAQATARSIISLDQDRKDSIDSDTNEAKLKGDFNEQKPIPTVEVTSYESVDEPIAQCDVESAAVAEKAIDSPDSHVFKYGDLSDCISKYLISTNDKADDDQGSIQLEKERVSIKSDEDVVKKSKVTNLNLRQNLLSTDIGESTEDIRALLEESLHGYCKSPSELLPIDSKLENDLETLLKMSAELLNDYSLESKAFTEQLDQTPDQAKIDSDLETSAMDMKPISDGAEIEQSETRSNRSSTYLDADALQLEMESVAGDISATISSIKNTIKSIDSLCQDDDRRSRTDKTLDDIIKVVEKIDEENETRKSNEAKSADSDVSFADYQHNARSNEHGSSDSPRLSSRFSRDRSRLTSPRRRKDDDFGEYDSRARRAASSNNFIDTSNRYSDDFTTKFKFDDISSGSSDNGSKSKLSSPYKAAEKLEIRHTTVTATFYDRFLSQKYEQQHKTMDRSPSSPVINKAYLNSLKPTSSLTSSYSSCSDKRSRSPTLSSFSSERNRFESYKYVPNAPKSAYLHLPIGLKSHDSCTRSCENILSNLSSTSSPSEFVPKYAYQTTKTSSDIFSSSSRRNIDSETILKRHSTGAYYQNTNAFPIKPKKPSEIGIKLGLYKPE